MTKFAALSATDLRTYDCCNGRLARKAQFVVTCEADDGSWFELDADDQAHAKVLANNQVDNMNCRSASCWRVNQKDGYFYPRAFYIYCS